MQAIQDEMETIHLYVVREQVKKPYTMLPIVCAALCLLGIVVLTFYSAEHPYYEHERLTVPVQFLPLKVFTAEAPIIPTGVKTYPATYAHGFLTFSNGSVISQSVPAGFTIDSAETDQAVYIPPASANGFGISTVSAHLLAAGINLPTLTINEVVGSSLFIRNLSPFTGGKPDYAVMFATARDKQTAFTTARNLLASAVSGGYHYPCREDHIADAHNMIITWRCQFVMYRVPLYMHVVSAKLAGKNFLVDVMFIARPTLTRTRFGIGR